MRTMLHVCLLAALLAALLVLGSAEDGARLLASKSLLNRYAVEGRDLTLQYNIYNVGSRSAPGRSVGRSIDRSIDHLFIVFSAEQTTRRLQGERKHRWLTGARPECRRSEVN